MEKFKSIVKAAVKNVWYNKTKYVYFAIFLILVQSLLSCVILFNYNNNKNALHYLEDSFTVAVSDERQERYHVVLNNLSPNQSSDVLAHYAAMQESDRYYSIVLREKVELGTSVRYNLYLYFFRAAEPDTTPYELYQRFVSTKMFKETMTDQVTVQETPYLQAFRTQLTNNAVTVLLCVLITAIGSVMFAILFNTVVNHFKFSYGVYMTFGANFSKLLANAISEMLVINVMTFVPSFGFSILITYFLTMRAGYGVSIIWYPMFLALFCSACLTVIAVTFVIKRLSVQTPDKLIRSINNVGLITSPRFSKRISEKGFPVKSEILSLKRFVKYIVSLVLSTVVFAALYCGGVYVMQMQQQKESVRAPQFNLTFPTSGVDDLAVDTTDASGTSETPEEDDEDVLPPILESATGYTYTSDVSKHLYSIDGVDYIVKDRSVLATTLKSHILISPSDLTLSGKLKGVKNTDGTYGFCNVSYKLCDSEVLDNIVFLGGKVEGDIESVLNDPYVIAISDSINNSRVIKLEVGDTIRVATSYRRVRLWPSDPVTSYKDFMEACFRCYHYTYVELTVGAIVSDLPVGSEFPMYMNAATFKEVTQQEPYFANVSLYLEDGLSSSEVQSIQLALYDKQQFYKMAVENTDSDTEKMVQYLKNYPGIILYISLLLLFVSVLITTLNQTLFYQMRKQELDIYLCLGSNFKYIRRLFWVDGIFFSVLSGIVYTAFSYLVTAIIFKIVNLNVTASLVRYRYVLPLDAYVFGLAVVLGASFFSVMLSYLIFKKRSAPVFTGASVAGVETGDSSERKSAIFDSDIR